jgi:hypothetical protein
MVVETTAPGAEASSAVSMVSASVVPDQPAVSTTVVALVTPAAVVSVSATTDLRSTNSYAALGVALGRTADGVSVSYGDMQSGKKSTQVLDEVYRQLPLSPIAPQASGQESLMALTLAAEDPSLWLVEASLVDLDLMWEDE